MAIDGPVAGLQIGFEGSDQPIEPRIEHRTMIEVDDSVRAALVVAGPQSPLTEFEGDHGTVPVTEVVRGGEQGAHRGVEAADALQGRSHPLLFPLLLTRWGKGLQGAAAAAIREDAGGTASLRGGGQHRHRFRQPVAPGAVDQTHPQPLAGQTALNEHHRPPVAAETPALLIEVVDRQLQLGAHPQGRRFQWMRGHRPEGGCCDPIGSAGPALQRAVTPCRFARRNTGGAR